jgi:hypothetical protein
MTTAYPILCPLHADSLYLPYPHCLITLETQKELYEHLMTDHTQAELASLITGENYP